MKAKTFENLIRKVVREEIDYSLRREIKSLKEDLRDELKPTITENTTTQTEISEDTKYSLREKIMGTTPIKQHKKKNFVSDGTLNDLLNETAAGSTNTATGNAPVNMSQPFATGAPMNTNDMPEGVAKAVTRDYSSLMKAIDKKKGR